MITSLRLQNVESHKNTLLEFSPGLNVIVGDSDKGKSGLFRGYQWLTENTPGGEWMRPLYWKGKSIVTGVFTDPDLTLRRIRSNSTNNYVLNDKDPINAGTSVPEDIKALLDLDNVNLQTQTERAFLMFETAGERGRILNRIAGLDKIEFTISNANADVNKLDKLWKQEKAVIKQKTEELENFVDIEDMGKRMSELTLLQSLESRSKNRIYALQKLLKDIQSISGKIAAVEPLTYAEPILIKLEYKKRQVEVKQLRVDKLQKLLDSCAQIERKESLEKFLGIEKKFYSIEQARERLKKAAERKERLEQILSSLNTINEDIDYTEKEIESIQIKIPNICTECGREL